MVNASDHMGFRHQSIPTHPVDHAVRHRAGTDKARARLRGEVSLPAFVVGALLSGAFVQDI
jgi:hypothetical protein